MENIKDKYDNRLNQYFNSFMNENINGTKVKIQPKSKDIPIIQRVGYSEEDDVFEIVFEILPQDKVHQRKSQNVTFFDDLKGRLVGIHINDVKKIGIKNIQLILDTNLEREIKEISIQLEKGEGDISLTLIEKRKMKYLKDIVSRNLDELSKIKKDF